MPEGPRSLPDPSNQAVNSQDNHSLDSFKLKLTREDFESYDVDGSNSLSLKELGQALKSAADPEKKAALQGLSTDLAMRPRLGDKNLSSSPELESWFGREFAKKQLSRQDFGVIDANQDDILSKDELQAAVRSDALSPMDRHAAGELLNEMELDASMDDPLLAVDGFRNWHKQRDATEAALQKQKEFAVKSPNPGVNLMVDARDTTVLATDARGLPTELITNAERYKLFYDSTGRIMEMQGKDGWKKTVSYDDARGTQKISSYDDNGKLQSTELRAIDHNQMRMCTQIVDASGNRTTINYDSRGREISKTVVNGDGRTETRAEYEADGTRRTYAIVYDATGKRRSETSRVGNQEGTRVKDTNYDDQGRIVEKIDMNEDRYRRGTLAQSRFDSRGNLLGTTEVKYDYNRVIELTDRNADGEVLHSEMPYMPQTRPGASSDQFQKGVSAKEMQTVPVRHNRSRTMEETLRALNRYALNSYPVEEGIELMAVN